MIARNSQNVYIFIMKSQSHTLAIDTLYYVCYTVSDQMEYFTDIFHIDRSVQIKERKRDEYGTCAEPPYMPSYANTAG